MMKNLFPHDTAHSPGQRLRAAIHQEQPLQMVGTINAYCALMAQETGFKALYLSGAGVANACYGLPDLGMTSLNDILTETRRITSATMLPLLVDADTGFGSALSIERTVTELIRAGAAGLHIEDQATEKRCGHRPNKRLVEPEEMCARLQAAIAGRIDPNFVIMARTDAIANEGLAGALKRAAAYVEAGADMIFAEAVSSISDYEAFVRELKVPILANMTEFGRTPLMTVEQLKVAGVSIALYPLSAFRAMNAAALNVYQVIKTQGTQENVLSTMQTRDELYRILNYHAYEKKIDKYS